MNDTELVDGGYYTIRGAESLVLGAYVCPDGVWVLEEEEGNSRYIIRGNDLVVCDGFGNEYAPSGWTLADVIPYSRQSETYVRDIAHKSLSGTAPTSRTENWELNMRLNVRWGQGDSQAVEAILLIIAARAQTLVTTDAALMAEMKRLGIEFASVDIHDVTPW